MDRHLKWLRRRIIASVATQTAETFAVVAVVAFVVMYWRTSEGPLTSLFGAVVLAQLVAAARVAHAMRRNPLNYVFMRNYVDRPFSYRVSRFQGEDEAHPVAARLPGFAPVATIRDSEADPEPVFDVYHDPSRLVAASVNRVSGAIVLISSLDDGRILVTGTRAMPPHQRLVMSLADDDSVESVISTHRRAVSARSDVTELASSAHQVVLDSLVLEYDAYAALGPALSPFLDLEPHGRSVLRLMARIETDELVDLPKRLGPDLPTSKARAVAPAENPVPAAKQPPHTEVAGPHVVVSDMEIHEIVAPIVEAPIVEAPIVSAPIMDAPQIALPVAAAAVPVVPRPVEPSTPVVEPVEPVIAEFVAFADTTGPSISAAPAGTDAPVRIGVDVGFTATPIEVGPTPFVTRYPEHVDVDRPGEPVTAEVPAIMFTSVIAPVAVAPAAVVPVVAPAAVVPAAVVPVVAPAAVAPVAVVPVVAPAAVVPVVAPVAVESSDVVAPVAVAPVENVVESSDVVAPVAVVPAVVAPVAVVSVENVVESIDVVAPLPPFADNPPLMPATLAEAVVPAPDTAAMLHDAFVDDQGPGALVPAMITAGRPHLGADLAAALGYNDEPAYSRPRLSAVLRANSAAESHAKRARRKQR